MDFLQFEILPASFFALAIFAGFYMAWNIGANDVANAMGTSVGSHAITLGGAVLIAAIFEFSGAFFVGAHVTKTVREGIIDTTYFENPETIRFLLYGMLAALFAAGTWLLMATKFGWPVSTTHSIVGAIVGIGLVTGGSDIVKWDTLLQISASWITSPLLSGTIAFFVFTAIRKLILDQEKPINAIRKYGVYILFVSFFIMVAILMIKGFKHIENISNLSLISKVGISAAISLLLSLAFNYFIDKYIEKSIQAKIANSPEPKKNLINENEAILSAELKNNLQQIQSLKLKATSDYKVRISRITNDIKELVDQIDNKQDDVDLSHEFKVVEKVFAFIQVISAIFVAFAHGANDVANAIGPLATIISIGQQGISALQSKTIVSPWLLACGGVGIVIGLATWGYKVIEMIGKRITELTPTRGFSAEISAALTIVVASIIGMPVSTTHTLVGAVLGVGVARGMASLNKRAIRDIFASWIITIPAGMLLSMIFYYILLFIYG
jgi:inorganic phosphate transporter, PiT family